MEYEEYKEQVIDKTPDSTGMLYAVAMMWLHPNQLPIGVIHMGNCIDRVVKIPNWSEKTRILQWDNGPSLVKGPEVPVIAFNRCVFAKNYRITDIILQSNIERIPTGAFEGCKNLKRICIPKKIKYIGEGTFKDCESLEDVYYAGSEEDWKKVQIIHCGAKPKEPQKLGLHVEIEHYDIPGNEALLKANIHYNCDPKAQAVSGLTLKLGSKDISSQFKKI